MTTTTIFGYMRYGSESTPMSARRHNGCTGAALVLSTGLHSPAKRNQSAELHALLCVKSTPTPQT